MTAVVTPEQLIRRRFAESAEAKHRLADDSHVAVTAEAARVLASALRSGGKAIFCGNGGSAADASHLAAELVGRFAFDRPALPAIALCDNPATVSCIPNDYAFEELFARQVRAHARPGDVLVALSTSGTSPNVLRAAEAAREAGCAVIGLTGAGGDELAARCDLVLRAPSDQTPRIQECHMLVGHTLCELVERELFAAVPEERALRWSRR